MKSVFDYQMEWSGLKNRLASMFHPDSGRVVMLAVDHGYFQGAAAGLVNLRKTVEPLLPFCDAISPTVGGLKSSIDVRSRVPVILRATGGNSMRRHDEIDDEIVTVSVEEMVRLNAVGFTASCYVGLPHQKTSIQNLTDLTNDAHKYGLIAVGTTAVAANHDLTKLVMGERQDGRELSGDDRKEAVRYLKHAVRILSETGTDLIKTYYCDGFEEIVEASLCPLLIAGGSKRPTKDALDFTYSAIKSGAVGVDMGRNIFQNENPVCMIRAVRAIVHEGKTSDEAFEMYRDFVAESKA